jgi:hypothetical protein
MLIGGLLQIILFFKIWGMTNDVRDLREFKFPKTLEGQNKHDRFLFLIYNGYKEEAKRFILSRIWADYNMLYFRNTTDMDWAKQYFGRLKEKYKKEFELLGEEFPAYELIMKEKKESE